MKMEAKNVVCSFILIFVIVTSSVISASATYRVPCPPPPGPSTRPGGGAQLCPINALKLGVCADVLNGLVHVVIGDPNENKCCSVLGGLLELEAAVCLCTAIKANILGLNINIPIALNLLITCGNQIPNGFVCKVGNSLYAARIWSLLTSPSNVGAHMKVLVVKTILCDCVSNMFLNGYVVGLIALCRSLGKVVSVSGRSKDFLGHILDMAPLGIFDDLALAVFI